MKVKLRKFILYPLMDLIFNYKTKESYLYPMSIELGAHPTTSKKLQELDVRTITYDEWIKHIKLWKK